MIVGDIAIQNSAEQKFCIKRNTGEIINTTTMNIIGNEELEKIELPKILGMKIELNTIILKERKNENENE